MQISSSVARGEEATTRAACSYSGSGDSATWKRSLEVFESSGSVRQCGQGSVFVICVQQR